MESRLRKIERQLGAQDLGSGEPILIVPVRTWPADDQAAFLAASDAERTEMIQAHCGRRPPPAGPNGAIRLILDLPTPPMDPTAAAAEADRIVRQETKR